MVNAVQRPRGPLGWSPTYAHLGWPSDVTVERITQWRREYDAEMMESGQMPPARNPTQPPETSCTSGLTGKTRYRLSWRGRLVLQVEYRARRYVSRYAVPPPWALDLARYWRDATVEDLQILHESALTGSDCCAEAVE